MFLRNWQRMTCFLDSSCAKHDCPIPSVPVCHVLLYLFEAATLIQYFKRGLTFILNLLELTLL